MKERRKFESKNRGMDINRETTVCNNKDFSLIIPIELFINIFSYLTVKELGQMSLVNQFWNSLAKDNSLWTHLSIRNGYGNPSQNLFNLPHDGKQYYYRITRKVDVHLSSLLGHKMNLKFFHHGKIEDFKDEICKQRNTWRNPGSSFPQLWFAGKSLENQNTLASYNIQKESIVQVSFNRAVPESTKSPQLRTK